MVPVVPNPTVARLVLLDKIAPRAGFYLYRGGIWIKEWPSGKQWQFDAFGQWARILDAHGRVIRNMEHGITVVGLLSEALRHER